MKTRSNMPLYVLEVSDVKTLSNAQIDLLRCGDYLVKKDASGEHAYKVTFKSDTGMCITYHDASVIETQSYDKIDGVWTYNSEDKSPNLLELQNVEDAPDGTINKALGLDSNGALVKGSISGSTKLYKHTIELTEYPSCALKVINTDNMSIENYTLTKTSGAKQLIIINTNSQPYISSSTGINAVNNAIKANLIVDDIVFDVVYGSSYYVEMYVCNATSVYYHKVGINGTANLTLGADTVTEL